MSRHIGPEHLATALQSSLYLFIKASFAVTNPGTLFVEGDYLELLASKLQSAMEGKPKRLMINLPPRCAKSHIANAATAWHLGHHPHARFISASYGESLAEQMGGEVRAIMQSEMYKSTFKTRLVKASPLEIETTDRGGRRGTSVGGAITGFGADIIIADDPMKADEANSDGVRTATNEWFNTSLLSRLNNRSEGVVIVIMQRLHIDDLCGYLLARDPEAWTVLSLPAIAEVDECIAFDTPRGPRTWIRNVGEALHPDRDLAVVWEGIRKSVGEPVFNAQYQQNPHLPGGGLLDKAWLNFYHPHQLPPNFDHIVQSWDVANKANKRSDYSVCTTWGIKNTLMYLLDVYRDKIEYPELEGKVVELHRRHKATVLLIEDAGSGTVLQQVLTLEGLKPIPIKPQKDKLTRFHAHFGEIKSGQVLFPTHAIWLSDYVDEITRFPGTRKDDQVDSTSQALDWRSEYCSRPRGCFEADFGRDSALDHDEIAQALAEQNRRRGGF